MPASHLHAPLAATGVVALLLAAAPALGGSASDTDGGYAGQPPGSRSPSVSGIRGVDRVAPRVRLRVLTRRLGTLARTGRLRVSVRSNELAIVNLAGTVRPGRSARRAEASLVLRFPDRTIGFRGPRTKTVTLRLSRPARLALRGRRSARVSVRALASDAVNNERTVRVKRTLRG